MLKKKLAIGEISYAESSNVSQQSLTIMPDGDYPVFGAEGVIKKIQKFEQKDGYIAIIKDGAGVGRTSLLPPESTVIGTLNYIKPKKGIDLKYLYQAFKSLNFKKYIVGSGIPHIYFNDYKVLEVLVPDYENQKKIGAFFSAIDRLIEKQRSRLNLLNQHKRDSINKFFRVNFSHNNSTEIQLKDFASFVRGVSYKPQNLRETSSSNTITLLRSNNIQKGKILLNEVQHVDSECVNDNQLFLLGDLFICTANGSKNLVGKTAIFTIDKSASKFTFGAFMGVIRSHQVKDSNYLYYLLNSVQFKEHLNILLAGTNINNLRGSQVMNLTFTIHKDSKVRDHIGFFLSKFDALIDLEEIKLTALISFNQGYLQKIFADQEGNL